ncbi:hypothetical protein [Sutcliffiella halmapala]|uniref:hypothetical protein n=1 Tax=Sutcliffiella halmapala TaxID=79882 RepID=UPI000995A86B|nr:hypothetical protein [Sutcliffiella halmapala]
MSLVIAESPSADWSSEALIMIMGDSFEKRGIVMTPDKSYIELFAECINTMTRKGLKRLVTFMISEEFHLSDDPSFVKMHEIANARLNQIIEFKN